MELIKKKVSDLIPYINNSRTHSEEQITQLISSIKEFGFTNPILLSPDNSIIAGHGRLLAVKRLGYEEVPCIIVQGLTKTQIKALIIADNQLALNAGWDLEKLSVEIEGLKDEDFNIDILGFNDDFIKDLLFKENQGLTDEDDVPETSEQSITKLGDIWKLGNHKLICGDSTLLNSYEKLFGENKADLLMTDPPYNVDYEGGTKDKLTILNDSKSDNDFLQFLTDAFNNCAINLKLGCSFYIFHSDWFGLEFRQSIKNTDLEMKQNLIWQKNSLVIGRQDYQWQHEPCLYGWKKGASHSWYSDRKQTTIIKFDRPTKSKLHPTMKPVGLIEYLIKNSSKQEDIILDPFLGSGTTLMACEKLQRFCYGIELDPKYCDVIIKRWQQFTGKEAIHEQSGKTYNSI
jgi:site-specific DNA-methyltransferase (adenine-specific)